MKLYLAAVYTNNYRYGQSEYLKLLDNEQTLVQNVHKILESYHYVEKQKFVDEMRCDNAKIFLDSGAFSAFTLNKKIDLLEYCAYIKRNKDIILIEDGILMASVLDGIGDPLQTYRNQLHMEELGIKPLPCFHFKEDLRYLEYYIQNYEYITLGGLVGQKKDEVIRWLDKIWEKYLIDGTGEPRIKIHAFGVTSMDIMERYPWYSVDSSSWQQNSIWNGILTPDFGSIAISNKTSDKYKQGRHALTLNSLEQKILFDHLKELGFTYDRLSTSQISRGVYNLWAYGVIESRINTNKSPIFKSYVQELFE